MVFEIYAIFHNYFCDYNSGILMYLIQDYSHTNKHLKIDHTFSSKKHPIYYSYDEQTFQTYLTKVIYNKNAQIINYYKYHIHENILPYLKMKNNSSKPSNLRLFQDNTQIMIKINQIEKDRNMGKLRDRINNHLKQMRTFKLIKNMKFKNELQNMEQFIKRIQKSQEEIQRLINEVQSSISNINNLHQQFSLQQLTPELSQRLEQQRAGQELIMIEKLKLFNDLSEFEAKKQNIIWQDIKFDRSEQMKKSIEAFSDATHQCISCLNVHENYFNIQEIFQMLKQDQAKLKEQQGKIYEANVLYITRKFIKGTTLRQMILSKDNRITPLFCRDLSKTIVDFILRDGGVRNLFITSENIIVEDFGKFHLNYFSLVGLQFVKLQKYVSKGELQQILPYLSSNYIDSNNPSRQMDLQILLRFIMVNFVSAYFNKDIVYDYHKADFQVEVRRDRVEMSIKRINNELLPNILTQNDIQYLRQNFDKQYFVNYAKLVQFIFTKRSRDQLTWEYILSLMGCTIPFNKFTSNPQQSQFTLDYVLNYLFKYLTYPSAKCFDWISINIFQAFHHFIDILQYFTENTHQIVKANDKKNSKQNQENKQKYSEKRKMFQNRNLQLKLDKMKKMSKQLSVQREYFKNKGRYSHILYLPIKCRFTFSKILDYHNWIGLLAGQKNPDQQTYSAAQNLFNFLLEIQQTMIFLSDYISDEIIQKTIIRNQRNLIDAINIKKETKQQQQYHSSYKNTYGYFLREYSKKLRYNQQNQQDMNIIQDYSDGDSDRSQKIQSDQSLKNIILKSFFKTTKIVFFILKYYFRNMNEIQVAGGIKIHYGFAKTLESFVPYEPFHIKQDGLRLQDQ